MYMHKRLAHRIIKKGDWYMTKLYSGMQTPLIDAVRYLADIKDVSAIPKLKALLQKYYTKQSNSKEQSFPFAGGKVTVVYGPMQYMPERIQTEIVWALVALMKEKEVKAFAYQMLAGDNINKFNPDSIKKLGSLFSLNKAV
jgi:N-formylglutamate amidohydrolase